MDYFRIIYYTVNIRKSKRFIHWHANIEKPAFQWKRTGTRNKRISIAKYEKVVLERNERMGTEFVEKKRWVFLGLPWTFTKYTVKEDLITINTGFLSTQENDCYMYKVQDVELTTSFWERIFKLGTVVCYTGDTTNPKLLIEHIKNAREVKNFILEMSEAARIKRRTLNTLNIGASADLDADGDGIPDVLED